MYVDLVNTNIPEPSVTLDASHVHELIDNVGGVYFLYDFRGDLLYVGKSVRLKARIGAHIRGQSENTKHFCTEISYFECITTNSRLDQDVLETIAINTRYPKYNKDKLFVNKSSSDVGYFRELLRDIACVVTHSFNGNACFGEVYRMLRRKGYDYVHLNTVEILTALRTIGIRNVANTFEVLDKQRVEDFIEVQKGYEVVKDRLAYLSIVV